MKKNLINKEHIEGLIYDHSLTMKKVENKESQNFGKTFITGSIDVMTDNNFNVIPVHFTYVTAETAKGKKNYTYDALAKIISEGKTVLANGPEEAFKIKIDTALGLNDFYADDGRLVSTLRNEGGFVSLVNKLEENENKRNTFETDIVITSLRHYEADENKPGDKDCLYLKGCIFDFRASVLPVEFKVDKEEGIKYFEDLDISPANPVFTKVLGNIISNTIVDTKEEDSAFGGPIINTTEKKVKEWVVNTCLKEPYGFGEPKNITAEELTKAMQEREVHLAEVKKRSDEYKAKKNTGNGFAPMPASAPADMANIAKGSFNF